MPELPDLSIEFIQKYCGRNNVGSGLLTDLWNAGAFHTLKTPEEIDAIIQQAKRKYKESHTAAQIQRMKWDRNYTPEKKIKHD